MITQTELSTTERCHRCGGLMVKETFTVDGGPLGFEGWRCVICGEIIDPLIMANRMATSRQWAHSQSTRKLRPRR